MSIYSYRQSCYEHAYILAYTVSANGKPQGLMERCLSIVTDTVVLGAWTTTTTACQQR